MAEKKLTIILAAGGTGGHIFPAESLASLLIEKGHEAILVTDKRYKKRESTPENMVIETISSASTGGGMVRKLKAVIAIIIGFLQARKILKKVKPDVVVGFGGYPSFPTMAAAISLKRKIIIHEQNSVMGRVNKVIVPYADKIATSFPATSGIKEKDSEKIVFTGNPVRPAIKALRDFPYAKIGDDEQLHILVIGGSQGAKIFSDVVPEAILLLPGDMQKRIRIDQQCREEDLEKVRQIYKKSNISADLKTFFEDVPTRLAAAHLVIARAGASTIAELTVAGRPSILVPYMHAMDDHQTANAKALENAGGAIVIDQAEFTPDMLMNELNRCLKDSEFLEKMAAGASGFGEVGAVEKLLGVVLGGDSSLD